MTRRAGAHVARGDRQAEPLARPGDERRATDQLVSHGRVPPRHSTRRRAPRTPSRGTGSRRRRAGRRIAATIGASASCAKSGHSVATTSASAPVAARGGIRRQRHDRGELGGQRVHRGIERPHPRAGRGERLAQLDRGRAPQRVGAGLVGQAPHRDVLAGEATELGLEPAARPLLVRLVARAHAAEQGQREAVVRAESR